MTSAFDDCVSILGTYDLTFQLPNVPPGTYELRLGYGSMPDRGIVQMYVDNVPQGLPLDMREEGDSPIIGGLYNGWNGWRNSEENANGIYTSEELEENARVMKTTVTTVVLRASIPATTVRAAPNTVPPNVLSFIT